VFCGQPQEEYGRKQQDSFSTSGRKDVVPRPLPVNNRYKQAQEGASRCKQVQAGARRHKQAQADASRLKQAVQAGASRLKQVQEDASRPKQAQQDRCKSRQREYRVRRIYLDYLIK